MHLLGLQLILLVSFIGCLKNSASVVLKWRLSKTIWLGSLGKLEKIYPRGNHRFEMAGLIGQAMY